MWPPPAVPIPAPPLESPLNILPLRLKTDWEYEQDGDRRHYLIEALTDRETVGRAHGWFEPGANFVLEKIEMAQAHRSRGHGTALIAELRAKARQSGCTALVIRNVRTGNAGAIRLYESLGAVASPPVDGVGAFVIAPP